MDIPSPAAFYCVSYDFSGYIISNVKTFSIRSILFFLDKVQP